MWWFHLLMAPRKNPSYLVLILNSTSSLELLLVNYAIPSSHKRKFYISHFHYSPHPPMILINLISRILIYFFGLLSFFFILKKKRCPLSVYSICPYLMLIRLILVIVFQLQELHCGISLDGSLDSFNS